MPVIDAEMYKSKTHPQGCTHLKVRSRSSEGQRCLHYAESPSIRHTGGNSVSSNAFNAASLPLYNLFGATYAWNTADFGKHSHLLCILFRGRLLWERLEMLA